MDYSGKTVLVLGLGESGLAMARWLAQGGASLRVADTREAPDRLAALREHVPAAEFRAGSFDAFLLDGVDFVAVSPGLSPLKELAALLPAAEERGVPVWGEIELFAQALAALKEGSGYAPKVIAITGTNGKTTVTSMTGQLVRRAGLTVQVAGNISPAALDVLREMHAAGTLPQAWVLELSSFQLHFTHSLTADAATVLNVTQDHLDWHGSMEAYAADKARIFGANTTHILNRGDARTMAMASPLAPTFSFGTDAPDEAGCFGLLNENGMTWLAFAAPTGDEDDKPRRKKDSPIEKPPVLLQRLMPVDALKVRGLHNATNALAALALCRALNLPLAALLHGLREYAGEPHRVALVQTIGGVEYYDDSKGTNVGATAAALNGLGPNQSIVLIAGGDGKGQDFAPLAEPVQKYVKTVLLIGRDAPAIRAALAATGISLIDCTTLEEAVQRASGLAEEGNAVLLSPACASLDMFKNYAHRAEVFIDAVREVALSRGELA